MPETHREKLLAERAHKVEKQARTEPLLESLPDTDSGSDYPETVIGSLPDTDSGSGYSETPTARMSDVDPEMLKNLMYRGNKRASI